VCRIDGRCIPAEVLKNPRDHRRILDAGDDPQLPAVASADLGVDGEHPLEALRPGQEPLPGGGRWLAARPGCGFAAKTDPAVAPNSDPSDGLRFYATSSVRRVNC